MRIFCREQSESVGEPKCCINYDRYGILLRKPKLHEALQKAIPERIRHWLLALAHCLVLAGPLGGTRMYYTLSREYYLPQIACDVFSTVQKCQDYIRLWESYRKHQKLMKVFAAAGHL